MDSMSVTITASSPIWGSDVPKDFKDKYGGGKTVPKDVVQKAKDYIVKEKI